MCKTTIKILVKTMSEQNNLFCSLLWPIRPADEIDNVKPMLEMKKRHEETKDATKWSRRQLFGAGKALLLATL
jgi:hypothetical protein